jgi:hypothetical protein
MVTVELTRDDWINIVSFLTEIRDADRFAIYIDDIVDKIDSALEKDGGKDG